MFAWLSANLINLILIAVIVLIVALLIRSMILDKKAGKSSCGGNCASCGVCSSCSTCGSCNPVKTVRTKTCENPSLNNIRNR